MFAAIPIGLFLIGAVVVFEGELVVTEAVPGQELCHLRPSFSSGGLAAQPSRAAQ